MGSTAVTGREGVEPLSQDAAAGRLRHTSRFRQAWAGSVCEHGLLANESAVKRLFHSDPDI